MSPSDMESAKAGHTITFTSSPNTLEVNRVLDIEVLESIPTRDEFPLNVAFLVGSLTRLILARVLTSLT